MSEDTVVVYNGQRETVIVSQPAAFGGDVDGPSATSDTDEFNAGNTANPDNPSDASAPLYSAGYENTNQGNNFDPDTGKPLK